MDDAATLPIGCDRTLPEHIADPEVGDRVGRYRLVERLGVGGMGTVYRASDPSLQRWVAVKVMHGSDGDRDLLREARGMAMIVHDNIVPIYGVERTVTGHWALAMELVEGMSLQAWLDTCTRHPAAIVEKFLAAGEGLAALHRLGLVHRDFKPANVLVGRDERVRLTDFGLVTSPDPATSEELEGGAPGEAKRTIVGTPAYMAPEQCFDADVDARADQFAFCVALWEALAGGRPFHARSAREMARVKLTQAPRGRGRCSLSRRLLRVVRRGLAPRREDRWGSMDELLRALRAELAPRTGRFVRVALTAALVVGGLTSLAAESGDGPSAPSAPELVVAAR